MSKELIEQMLHTKVCENGMVKTDINGVQLFKITKPIRCAPAVYEPSVTAIISGCKEAIVDGIRHFYDSSKYICCSMSMPIEAGTPEASQKTPLLGVYIRLDTSLMTELAMAMESPPTNKYRAKDHTQPQGLSTARWDENFTDALFRLLLLVDNPNDCKVLAKSRLRELYYAILKGDSGFACRNSFRAGNEISRSIEFLSSNLSTAISIEEMANQIGMSRAVFHRKFKQATSMSPIQFVKSMRLNKAAMKIAEGTNVNVAAMDVGYISSSQFSREFKRLYGLSPKQWSQARKLDN